MSGIGISGSMKRNLAETLARRTREGGGRDAAEKALAQLGAPAATGQDFPLGKPDDKTTTAAGAVSGTETNGKGTTAGETLRAGEARRALREGFRDADLKGRGDLRALLELQIKRSEEATGGVQGLLAKVDADGDGKVGGGEMKAFLASVLAGDATAHGTDTSGREPYEDNSKTGDDLGDFALGQAGKTLQDFERSVTQIGNEAGRAAALFAASTASAYGVPQRAEKPTVVTV